jgi:hypothetical protein
MTKQTAVEWLESELRKLPFVNVLDVFEKAKAMEKEQIVDAFDNGAEEWTPIEYSDGQHYYNHNFES